MTKQVKHFLFRESKRFLLSLQKGTHSYAPISIQTPLDSHRELCFPVSFRFWLISSPFSKKRATKSWRSSSSNQIIFSFQFQKLWPCLKPHINMTFTIPFIFLMMHLTFGFRPFYVMSDSDFSYPIPSLRALEKRFSKYLVKNCCANDNDGGLYPSSLNLLQVYFATSFYFIHF